MSKKSKVVGGSVGWENGYVVGTEVPDRLFGTIFNIIEALGLPSKQEEALKPLVRKQIWEVFEDAVFISSERHFELRELYYQKKLESSVLGQPTSAI